MSQTCSFHYVFWQSAISIYQQENYRGGNKFGRERGRENSEEEKT